MGQKQIVARVDRIEGAIPSAKEEKLWFSPEGVGRADAPQAIHGQGVGTSGAD